MSIIINFVINHMVLLSFSNCDCLILNDLTGIRYELSFLLLLDFYMEFLLVTRGLNQDSDVQGPSTSTGEQGWKSEEP